MLNLKLRNLFLVLFLSFSFIYAYGCSLKPELNKEIMKKTIIEKIYSRDDMRNLQFTKFEVKKSFYEKKNNESYHCVSVLHAYSIERLSIDTKEWKQSNDREKEMLYCFIKRGDSWDVVEEGEIR